MSSGRLEVGFGVGLGLDWGLACNPKPKKRAGWLRVGLLLSAVFGSVGLFSSAWI